MFYDLALLCNGRSCPNQPNGFQAATAPSGLSLPGPAMARFVNLSSGVQTDRVVQGFI